MWKCSFRWFPRWFLLSEVDSWKLRVLNLMVSVTVYHNFPKKNLSIITIINLIEDQIVLRQPKKLPIIPCCSKSKAIIPCNFFLYFLSVCLLWTDSVRALWNAHYTETDQFDLTTCSKTAYCCSKRPLRRLPTLERYPQQVPHLFKISYQTTWCCLPTAWQKRGEKERFNIGTFF